MNLEQETKKSNSVQNLHKNYLLGEDLVCSKHNMEVTFIKERHRITPTLTLALSGLLIQIKSLLSATGC
jgi:hypothetical protein